MPRSIFQIAADALKAIARGMDPGQAGHAAIAHADSVVGAPRPLSSYKPRTQRRYLAAARRGETAATVNARERAQRTTAGSRRAAQITVLWEQVNAEFGDRPIYSEITIAEARTEFGDAYVARVLREQLQSTRHYKSGDKRLGNSRWFDRSAVESLIKTDEQPTDVHYYYHGALH